MTDAATAPTFDTIAYSVEDGVAVIALNRPDNLNAMNSALLRDLAAASAAAEADDAVRVIVLAGEGKGFCSGADLADAAIAADVEKVLMEGYKPTLDAISASAKPWIAAIHGACAGIGASYAMQCDLAVMEESAYMYEAFAAIGLIPDGGAHWQLVRALGYKRAYAAIVGAEKLPAEACAAAGLVNTVVPDGTARQAALNWAGRLAQGAPRTMRHAKTVLRAAATESFDESFAREASLQGDCVGSEDAKNAIAAFFAKRKPVFTGA
ncbi:enoyl-CoA hydratase/isomerase family protein [Rhodovulum sp. DZ06]|uniref:enoyl-CoA hydratase/isomerase family protein n=1 Tax=Rhodovulum sp. DZ06 TaxID=3425126 RepID=UPI003D34802C